ncbi:unnamed protein product [Adineta steineri]|uniref:Uncharacterized protein n=1 Tax=Adineta steineri TaxID=433720 RepID=A0A813MH38_9BILA|nr:unnamed protein product [Adineta steineri]CAF3815455.1 unnamed protein product [Adineta steineri]
MSNRNNYFHGARHYTDPTPSRYNTKYNKRNGTKDYRPQPNRPRNGGDDVDTLMSLMDHHLPTNNNPMQESGSRGRGPRSTRGRHQTRSNPQLRHSQNNQTGWWRITIQQAGTIGKDRVMSTLKAHCPRQFQPYHYFIDSNTKAGVFFVNSQQDADMLKRANGKVEVQSLDILRIMVSRVTAPVPAIDVDIRPHFKDFLLNRRFDQQIFKLDLTNLADDEELSSLGIFPQFNKHAFIRDVVDIINKDLPMTRQLDLGSNNIMNLYEFRNLHLDNLVLLSVASNQLKNVDDFDNLKQLSNLAHIFIKNNPLTLSNNKRSTSSIDDIISIIQQKLPQLKRIDNAELKQAIRFATDFETTTLPKTIQHCVPSSMEAFLAKFIDEFYRLFDTDGRKDLHACYHDLCMLSLCITTAENSIISTRQYKYGALIYESRNLQRVLDDNKRFTLLRHGKTAVLDFLRVKFPLTKHDGNSFHVDVISTVNNRAVFTVNGLYRETDQGTNGPVRSFQRTFTCAQTSAGVLIIADHIMLCNATEAQISNMNRSSPPSSSSSSSSQPATNHTNSNTNDDIQNQMILKFSQESGMNIAYSRLCLQENNWQYDIAAQVFLDAKQNNKIPPEAFNKS